MTSPGLNDERFALWIRSLFDENPPKRPASMDNSENLKFVKKLFDDFENTVSPFPVDAVAKGLWRLINPGGAEEMHALKDENLQLKTRLDTIASLSNWLRYLEAHATPFKGCVTMERGSAINDLAHKWWDFFPAYPAPEMSTRKPFEAAFLMHFSVALKSKSPVVQEYGLHGFSHWQHFYPKEVKAAVDEYLKRNPDLEETLREYAMDTLEGVAC